MPCFLMGDFNALRRTDYDEAGTSPLFSPASPLHLPCISPASPLYLPYISPASPLYLAAHLLDQCVVRGGCPGPRCAGPGCAGPEPLHRAPYRLAHQARGRG